MKIITEQQFRERLLAVLNHKEPTTGMNLLKYFGCVTGPGRSGAIAAVYASHYLGIPYIPLCGTGFKQPVLVIDTAKDSGKTLRKAKKKVGAQIGFALFNEPPRVKFWYEIFDD